MENLENKEEIRDIYHSGREVYFRIMNTVYVYKIVKLNENNNTLILQHGTDVFFDVPLSVVDLEINIKKKKKKKKDNIHNENDDNEDEGDVVIIKGENESNYKNQNITINCARKVLKEINVIDKLTNSMISDLNRNTVYRNDDLDVDIGYMEL